MLTQHFKNGLYMHISTNFTKNSSTIHIKLNLLVIRVLRILPISFSYFNWIYRFVKGSWWCKWQHVLTIIRSTNSKQYSCESSLPLNSQIKPNKKNWNYKPPAKCIKHQKCLVKKKKHKQWAEKQKLQLTNFV